MAKKPISDIVDDNFDDQYSSFLDEYPQEEVEELEIRTFDRLVDKYLKTKEYRHLVHLVKAHLQPSMHSVYEKAINELLSNYGKVRIFKMIDGLLEKWIEELFNRIEHGAMDSLGMQRRNEVCAFAVKFQKYAEKWNQSRSAELHQTIQALKRGKPRQAMISIRDKRKITNSIFWELIDEAGKISSCTDVRCRWLKDRLGGFPAREIVSFANEFNKEIIKRFTFDNWGVAFIVNSGASDDGFLYFLGWLILQGEHFVHAFDANPNIINSKINNEEPLEEEMIFHVPEGAFNRVTDREFPDSAQLKIPRKAKGKPWTEEQLPKMFPKIYRAFNK